MSKEPIEESQDWLREAKSHIAKLNLPAARACLQRVFDRWPDHTEARRLLSAVEAREALSWDSGITEAFKASVSEKQDGGLGDFLEMLSKKYGALEKNLDSYDAQPARQRQMDEGVKIVDIAAIREHLSKGELVEADSRLNLALLSFPDDRELKNLESEIHQRVQHHEQLRQLIEKAEEHFRRREWEPAVRTFEAGGRLEPGNSFVRKRIATVLAAWARDLGAIDKKAAAKLARTSLNLDRQNIEVRDLHASLVEEYRKEVVDQAMSKARELQSNGELQLAEQTVQRALNEAPEEPMLVRYLKELRDLREEEQHQRDILEVEERALQYASDAKYGEALQLVAHWLKQYPVAERLLQLLDRLKRERQQHFVAEVAEGARRQIEPLLSQATIPALRQALQIAHDALRQLGDHPALSQTRNDLEKRISENEARLSAHLLQAEHHISGGEFSAASDSLQSASGLAPGDSRIEELRTRLRKARLGHLWAAHWKTAAALACVALTISLVARFWPNGHVPQKAKLIITTTPQNARVFINEQYQGNTPYEYSAQVVNKGTVQINVRLELQNYETFEKTLTLSPNQTENLSPQLKLTNLAAEIQRLRQLAEQALEQGNLLVPPDSSALAYLNQMKETDPHDQMGQSAQRDRLLNAIKTGYKNKLSQFTARERGTEIELSMLTLYINLLDANDPEINARIAALNRFVQTLLNQIDGAITRGNLLPPTPSNASELVTALETQFPREKAKLQAKRNEIHAKVLDTARQKCGSKSASDCSSFIRSALLYYPDDPRLQSFREGKVEEPPAPPPVPPPPPPPPGDPLTDVRVKLEDAYKAKRYVVPQTGSAVYYANQILRSIATDPRALDLKQDSHVQAEKELEPLLAPTQEKRALASFEEATKVSEDFRRARELLEAIRYFFPENKVDRQIILLRTRPTLLEELLGASSTHLVIHNHRIGSCKGLLTITAHSLRYEADSGDDSFNRKFETYADVKVEAETLRLRFSDNKSWDFRINTRDSPGGSVASIEAQIRKVDAARKRIEAK